uniref:Ubiquinone/menaquinone biosynthesis C-methylase UbiE n=1 Tax=Candidatus Kentrum sp. FM TaxID=2126340 RepID=A0A450VN91_9GAMM|nr:MAG: Ubiquinone/menaquinone biosynthesis C-methylase UbiE [Candidatus Kentron sp. FM]VFJ66502.1 MAG: Ubiquinone/menaquinone biosynthesis C-methylase UbiE [Candidatus Kentron sp. FM]VFK06190.1 MAG: Ubiquinone/menaquinone biosynthesis C-methylase UbiE [Candidatus Kentron sp. FM]
MGQPREFVTPLHQATWRDYLARMVDDKAECMVVAKQYDRDYWDGDRRFGYGGYRYMPGRWKPVARALIDTYRLEAGSKVLDVGCGKGFLLHEMLLLEPELQIAGFDISEYGIDAATDPVKPHLFVHQAQTPYPYADNEFDLVISLGTLHNLRLFDLEKALSEIARVGRQGYVMVESYRNERELFNLQCWALTCESFFDPEEWVWLYEHFGYGGDYEFIYFE